MKTSMENPYGYKQGQYKRMKRTFELRCEGCSEEQIAQELGVKIETIIEDSKFYQTNIMDSK